MITYYVGAIPPQVLRQKPLDGRVLATGWMMDNACKVRFWASVEALRTYFGDEHEDRCIDVDEQDITWRSQRDSPHSLWSNAGLPWCIW